MAKVQEQEYEQKAEITTKKLTIEEMILKVKEEFPNLGDGAKLVLQQLIEDAQISSLDELTEDNRSVVEKMYELVL